LRLCEYPDVASVYGISDSVWKSAKQAATNRSTNLNAGMGILDDSLNVVLHVVEENRRESKSLTLVVQRSIIQLPFGESMERDARHLSKFRPCTTEHPLCRSRIVRRTPRSTPPLRFFTPDDFVLLFG
jgi:hypothetical protein